MPSISQSLSDLSDKLKSREIDKRELEHRLLQIIALEIDDDELDRATWLKAFSESEGDVDKSKALYVKLRLQRLLDQITAIELQARQNRSRQSSSSLNESRPKVPVHSNSPNRQSDERRGLQPTSGIGFYLILLGCLLVSFAVFYHLFQIV